MKKIHHRNSGICTLIGAIIITLSLTSIFSISYAAPAHAESSADGFEAELNNVRDEYLEALADTSGAAADLRTITVDTSNIIPAEQHDPILSPAAEKQGGVAPQMSPAEYDVDDSRNFCVNITGSALGLYTTLPGILRAQGDHTNVWVIDDDAYHMVRENEIHSDADCKLRTITNEMAVEIADNFDGIYELMVDPDTGFAPHSRVIITTGTSNIIPYVGDIDQDGRVNLVLYDIYGDGNPNSASYTSGYFWGGNFQAGMNPIDMLNVDIGVGQGYVALTTSDSISMYSTLAHEFQHMLFYMYYGIYLNSYFNVSWFNEAVSELAATYYVRENTKLEPYGRIASAAANSYNSTQFSDFFNHSNLKNYGMEKLFAMNAYKISEGDCAHDLYAYFKSTYPPSSNSIGYNNNRQKAQSTSNMKNAIGNMLKSTLGANLPSLQSMSDENALMSVYSLFMETFAADGGLVAAPTPTPTTKLYSGTYGANNLWGFRPAFGAPGRLYSDDLVSYSLSSSTSLPVLASGDTVSVSGYSGTTTSGVSCEKIYKLNPTDVSNPILNITVSDDNDTTGATRYYVALENPNPSGDTHYAGLKGADIFPLTKNSLNAINTNGRRAWLFVSTWFRTVNGKQVSYHYDQVPNAPTLSSKSDTTITLTAAAGLEYSIDGAPWQDSAIFTGLSPSTTYSFYQRTKKVGEYGSISASSPALDIMTNAYVTPSGITTPGATTPDIDSPYTTPRGIDPPDATPPDQDVSDKPETPTTTPEAVKLYKVKFDVNKGDKLPKNLATKKIKFGAKLGKLPTPKRSKYKFRGWYTKKSNGKKYTSQTKLNKKATLTLYAHWKRKK